ncbi:MAG: hypothetical protein JWL97_2969 [Gemmatimonadales bacterium]|nr:hypothetical protein [Gemmatimonadales bacterium]
MAENRDALVGNAADKEQVKKAEKKATNRDAALRDAWKQLLSTKAGLTVFRDVLDRYWAFGTVFDPNPVEMAFKAGQQDVSHYVMHQINRTKPEALTEMMRQSHNDKVTDQ